MPHSVHEYLTAEASEFTANGDAKEGSCTGSETLVLKLFGKKVVVNDTYQKPNTSTGNLQNGRDVGTEASDDTTTQGSRNLPFGGATEGSSWTPWPSNMQQFVYFVPQPDGFATQSAMVPWFGTLAWCSVLPTSRGSSIFIGYISGSWFNWLDSNLSHLSSETFVASRTSGLRKFKCEALKPIV
ncbi:Myb-like protein G [Hordeum vulgare]|nr:Myb-like protein G [Hordeum vulgare]